MAFKRWAVALLAVLWFGHSLKEFYTATAPPVCDISTHGCLTPKLTHGDSYVLRLTVTDSHRKQREDIGSISTVFGQETSCDDTVTQFHTANPRVTHSINRVEKSLVRRLIGRVLGYDPECVPALRWTMGDTWRSNTSHVFLSAFAMDKGARDMVFRSTQKAISLMYTPEKDRQSEHRYLLSGAVEESDDDLSRITSMSVPRLVKVGPIDIQDPLLPHKAAHWHIPKTSSYMHWLLIDTLASPRDEYQSLLTSTAPIEISFELNTISWRKASLQGLMLGGIEHMEKQFGTSKYDSDSLKLLLAGESPVILLITFVVSVLHLIFEFLAMSSSWVHFSEATQTQDDSDKVSARSVLLDVIFEIAILAWLRDTGEAKIVQYVLMARIIFNSWKYWKLRRVQSNDDTSKVKTHFSLIETCRKTTNLKDLKDLRSTMSADAFEAACLKTLTVVLSPFMIGLCVYQLIWVPQKSWASWIIKSLALTSYVGGFIAMTPQLYKNFYFRSVEHLPWTTLTYQFLNTIIDDLFSFLIRMPKAHRMSVFRDDIVFVIYWLQKRHYAKQTKDKSD